MLKSALRHYGLRAKWAGGDTPGDTKPADVTVRALYPQDFIEPAETR
jgi:hypothetical protein